MAVNYVAAAADNLDGGHNLGQEKGFCSYIGFMVEAFVNQSKWYGHFWACHDNLVMQY